MTTTLQAVHVREHPVLFEHFLPGVEKELVDVTRYASLRVRTRDAPETVVDGIGHGVSPADPEKLKGRGAGNAPGEVELRLRQDLGVDVQTSQVPELAE